MTLKERYSGVSSWFEEHMAAPATELTYGSNFGLLVAVILSAQCTDKRVNMVTPSLLAAYPTACAMSVATVDSIFGYIRSVSYPNAKAKHLLDAARIMCDSFGGDVPDTREGLESLPGVGRKTASVMLSVAFGGDEMAVDTHVHRVAARIGLTVGAKNVVETERQLVAGFARGNLGRAHHWLILHGRYVCRARSPQCAGCGISDFCDYFAKGKK